jgi:glutaredoxin-related protein
MFNHIPDLLKSQIKRATENGDSEEAMAQMKRFLEMERQHKKPENERHQNLRTFPALKLV